jgi:hypothetical protein
MRGRRHGVGEGRSRRVIGHRSGVGGEVSRSPRFSTFLIGLSSLGFVGAPWARRTLVPVPRFAPLLLWRCARGGPLPYTAGTPDQGADQISFPIRRSEDHVPNKSCYQTRGSGPIVILQLENVHSQNLGCSISLHLLSPKPCQPRGH